MADVRWSLRRTPSGYEGLVSFPAGAFPIPGSGVVRPAGPLSIKARGGSPASAIEQAADIADKIASNPIIAAALPPGTGAALKATKLVGKYGPKALKVITGAGAQRLANVILPGSGTAIKSAKKLFGKLF